MSSKLLHDAVEYLLKDDLSNIDILEPLRRGTADIIYAGTDGIIIYEQNSQACMISMQDLEKCQSIINLKNYHLFSIHQENIAEWLQYKGVFSHRFKVYQAVYKKREIIVDCFEKIRVLSPDYTDQIYHHYDVMNNRKYIETLIGRKQLWGIFDNDDLAGFIGVHLEGSMGLLEILPNYRRKGYGYQLEAFLINRFLQLNEVPFCQVTAGNFKSLSLQQKIGMDISKLSTTWLFN